MQTVHRGPHVHVHKVLLEAFLQVSLEAVLQFSGGASETRVLDTLLT
jgi:hypothetical protein